ncbi:DEAD-box ATP-dependent RNA helicase 20 isoform X1 [Amborella trichopoda]|uniref:DEAD-box ATP-dependent RNA helicase 20 isoform X1 n=1 Tax=Amborella trichopoda TaxID=13333 RepID=UPI0009BEC16B|nr:DEAD-box ATP-dependent RNA helicase 20 isoform X1 [Amborella trichopoda]|eukprot:XP_020527369.1 DEAD-box ATP-dependent RNA helicase 20 isoform X1 [Amborella trichopoda]
MAKGDDALRKKHNKVLRKRMRKDAPVSARIASVIAAKRRRKAGKRRMCEGMCFTLPTPDDPFNDKNDKKARNKPDPKSLTSNKVDGGLSQAKKVKTSESHELKNSIKKDLEENHKKSFFLAKKGRTDLLGPEKRKSTAGDGVGGVNPNLGIPSVGSVPNSLFLCLNAIQSAWIQADSLPESLKTSLFSNKWGIEFWKAFSDGFDILGVTEASLNREHVAWIVSTAAVIFATTEKGLSSSSPFLIYLVPSQDIATKVRSLCKPLKAIGFHTVSIHPGAQLDHQLHGLRSCKPEFLVATPERLLELVSLKALSLSDISMLVIDGLESFINGGLEDTLKLLKQWVSKVHKTVILSDKYGSTAIQIAQSLLKPPFRRLFIDNSIISESLGIYQHPYVCMSDEAKTSKVMKILKQDHSDQPLSSIFRSLVIVGTASKVQLLVAKFQAERFAVSSDLVNVRSHGSTPSDHSSLSSCSEKGVVVSVTDKDSIGRTEDIGVFQTIFFYDFPSSIEEYVEILSKMETHLIKGVIYSLCSGVDAPLAKPLIKVMEQHAQPVPETLKMLSDAASVVFKQ